MSPSLPADLLLKHVLESDDFHEAWPTWDEAVCPWNVPSLGGHGKPTAGWDPDFLAVRE